MEKIRCEDCIYSEEVENPMNIGTKTFVCHCDPPTVIIAPNPQRQIAIIGMFPTIRKDSWCGKGKKKESVQ